MPLTSGTGSGAGRRTLGRRRRRLYLASAALGIVGVLIAGAALAVYRGGRPEAYRPGETHAEVTERLTVALPGDAPSPRFDDFTQAAGLGGFRTFAGRRSSQLPEDMGSGAAWGDYDGDGDDDLFLVAAGGPLAALEADRAASLLYENLGDGTFEVRADFPETRILGMAAAWGDFDRDGHLDLVVSGYDTLRLFRNDAGSFVRDPGIPELRGFWSGVSWADFDNDGDLDLYVCGYVRYVVDPGRTLATSQQYRSKVPYTLNPASFEPERNLLFRNHGGRFEEVAARLGVDNPQGRSLGALWHDFDADGWLDLYVANDISDNALYLNRQGRFEDVSLAAWVADYRGAMGLAAGDWNADGDDDLFITHWIAQENALYDSLLQDAKRRPGDDGRGLKFMDVADQRGLGQIALQSVGWGAEFADFDGDGWLDLAVANGSTFETDDEPRALRPQASFLFWNRQGTYFHDLAPAIPALADPRVGRGLALSDYDSDGDVDLLIVDLDGGVRLLRNAMQTGNWIELRLRPADARPLIGTSVVATVLGRGLRRTVGGVSYLSQSSSTVHIGLGAATRVDRLEVHWAGGGRDTLDNLEGNTIWEIAEGEPAPTPVQGNGPGRTVAGPASRERVAEFWLRQRAAMRAMKIDGDLPTAIAHFQAALELDPEHEDSLYYLGNCLADTGDPAAALVHFETIIRRNPLSHRAHSRWGVVRAMTARNAAEFEEARRALVRADAINPEATGVLLVLGEIELMRGDVVAARQRFEWAVRTNRQSQAGFFFLAYLASRRGDEAAAAGLIGQAIEARQGAVAPAGSVAEGEVRRRMHVESNPLQRFIDDWNGSREPEPIFAALDRELERLSFLRPVRQNQAPKENR